MVILSLLFFFVAILFYMWALAHRNTVAHTVISLDGFPKSFEGMTIFFISDIHRRVVSNQLIETIPTADVVVIGGDLAEKGVPIERISENLRRLSKVGPLYFVRGNNDEEIDQQTLNHLFQEHHVTVLDNTSVTFTSTSNDQLHFLGIDDLTKQKADLKKAISSSGDGFRILISHDPRIVNRITRDQQIGLVLSGHTHGGQIRLFHLGLYEKGGLFERSNTTLFVSNGYGTTLLPLRLGAPAETHLLTLKSR